MDDANWPFIVGPKRNEFWAGNLNQQTHKPHSSATSVKTKEMFSSKARVNTLNKYFKPVVHVEVHPENPTMEALHQPQIAAL